MLVLDHSRHASNFHLTDYAIALVSATRAGSVAYIWKKCSIVVDLVFESSFFDFEHIQ
jgi:hypothetical protein